jgi:hypothetical protein
MRNNLLAGGVKTVSSCGGSSYAQQDNATNASNVFMDPAAGDFRPKAGSAAVDKVAHGTTFATDIGFDPKCIKVETDSAKKHGYSWWTNAPDFDYMKKIGGIKKCWAPRNRPQGSNQELGAYELSTSGCTTNAECADTDPCTDDSCSPEGECKHSPLASCGGGGTGSGGSGPVAGAGGASAGGAQNRGGDSGAPRGGAGNQGGGTQGGSASGGASAQAGKPSAAAGSSGKGGDSGGGCSFSAPSRSTPPVSVVSLMLAALALRRRSARRG